MIVRLYHYLRGYLLVYITGYSPERFLNLCSNKNILIWNLKSKEKGYEFYISINGFRQLKPILRKTGTKIQIVKRFGLPFFLHRYRKRKVFFIGILLFSLILYGLSLFIWDIRIEGNYTYTEDLIMDALKDNNISQGMMKKDVKCDEIEKMLRTEFEEITWASVSVSGTQMFVSIQENTEGKIEETLTSPCDLVAEKEGIILEIITRKGTPQVSVGSICKEGDILVSGIVEIIDNNQTVVREERVPSDADIYAKTVYQYEETIPLDYIEKVYTGNEKKEYRFNIFNKTLNLNIFSNKYEKYDIIMDERKIRLAENFYLPFSVGKYTIKEYQEQEKHYEEEEVKTLANTNLNLFCSKLEEKGVQILENNVKILIDGENCIAAGSIIVKEKIGIQKEITERTQEADEHN